jgi:ribose/xylose/arabinose/galactoside ABC-type transport system permease subunit
MGKPRKNGSEKKAKIVLRKNVRNLFLICIIIVLSISFSAIQPIFYGMESLMNMIRKTAVLFVVSIGMSLVMLTGGFDLSVGSNLALAGACGATILKITQNPLIAIVATILVASIIGLTNGIMIGKLKINSIVLTLAMLGMARSLALVIAKSSTISVRNEVFTWLGSFDLRIAASKVPVSLFFILVLYALFFCILNYSVFGKKLIAIGGNIYAAKVAGLSVEKNIVFVYLITGLLVGIGAVMSVGRSFSAAPLAGFGLEFEAISVVIIGGVSLGGGKVDIKGTFLSVLLLGIIFNGLTLTNVYSFYVEITKGFILLIAILVNHYLERFQLEY